MSLDESWEQRSGLVGKMAAGRYLIVSELAADHRRTLYEAENVELGKRVSLGVVHLDTPTGAEQRLRDGAKLCSLKDPGLVAVLDVGKLDSGDLFVATELPDGTSLRELTRGKLLEQSRALVIVRQLLDALAAAHAVGAVHGDVKPESVMLTTELFGERVKLLEVGVATLVGTAKSGDPRYSAPESSVGSIDERADVYGVGAVLFELLTGHPPFFAKDPTALRRLHAYAPTQTLKQRAPKLSFLPELEALVAKALEKKRDERFQSANEMIAALDVARRAVEAAQPRAEAPPPRKRSDSLLLLAQDLLPTPRTDDPVASLPAVSSNVDRQVRALPWWMEALKRVRRTIDRLRERLGRLDRRQRIIAAAVGGVLVIALVVLVASRGDRATPRPAADVAQHAQSLLQQGKPAQAIRLTEREVATHPDNGAAQLALGDAKLTTGNEGEALTAYENAILSTPTLASNPDLLKSLEKLTRSRDAQTAIAALDLLALRVGDAGNDVIVSASTNELADVRHHAFGLAERAGIVDRVDRVASWSLDLDQATTCKQRRAAIGKLGGSRDKAALSALQHAKTQKCGGHEARAAIHKLQRTSR